MDDIICIIPNTSTPSLFGPWNSNRWTQSISRRLLLNFLHRKNKDGAFAERESISKFAKDSAFQRRCYSALKHNMWNFICSGSIKLLHTVPVPLTALHYHNLGASTQQLKSFRLLLWAHRQNFLMQVSSYQPIYKC